MGQHTIIHVLSADVIGGCETGCINLASALAARGYHQEVVFLSEGDGSGPASARLRSAGIAAHYLPLLPRRGSFIRAFARHCRREKKPVIVCHSFGVHFYVAVAAKLGGASQVIAIAGNPPPDKRLMWLKSLIYVHCARFWTDREIGCTKYVADRMHAEYWLPQRRLAVLPYIIPVEDIRTRAEGARSRRDPDDAPVVGMVARLDPIKDHRAVLEAFSIVVQTIPQARLRLIGDGAERYAIERRAGELGIISQVEFLGARQDIPEQLGCMDVFVYGTTRNEGFGIVLAEAMSAGVPVVVTDVGPCREVLGGGRAGTLVPEGSPAALAEAILDELRRSMMHETVGHSTGWLSESYSAETVVPHFLSLVFGRGSGQIAQS